MALEVAQVQSHTRCRRRWLLVMGFTTLVAAGIWLWTGVFEQRFVPKRFGEVERGCIYRSGRLSAPLVKKVLAKYHINTIVDLGAEKSADPDQQAEKQAAAELNIRILRFSLSGNGTGDVNEYARAIAAVAEAQKNKLPVLVHCAAGAQRTGGVIAAYRLLVQKKTLGFVAAELEHYGCDINDKPALLNYLNNNMAELAKLLKKAGVIDEIPSPLPQLPQGQP
jgi:protein tyrosine/serine phosphatase